MTKTLTEQWREGTLPNGVYYLQYDNCLPFIYNSYQMIDLKKCKDSDKVEVLAPVPSYEEYQDIIQQNVNQEAAIETYIEDIKRLQEQKQKVVALIKDGRFVEALKELEVK